LIGFGNVAVRGHLPLWQESDLFSIHAVVEPDGDRAGLARDMLPEAAVYADIETLLSRNDLDFIDICTPPGYHSDIIFKALGSGLHVICEKPLICSRNDLHRMQKSAVGSQRVIHVVNNWKYAPILVKTQKILNEKRIGNVRNISLSVLRTDASGGGLSDWRSCPEIAGGGILLDHGWHQLYLILSMMADTPLSVSAEMGPADADNPRIEDTVDLVLTFPGARARLHLTWRAGCRKNFGTVEGDRGTLAINDDHLVLAVQGQPETRYEFSEALSGGSHHSEWMKPVITDFHREIIDPEIRGTNFNEALWCATLIDLAYRSCREGARFVEIEAPAP
jgi:predicted dehydrogenase